MCKDKSGIFQGTSGDKASSTPAPNKLPANESQLKHIFRNADGHLSDTPENRHMITETANNPANYVGADKYGNSWFSKFDESKMKRDYIFLAMYRAMDCLYDEQESPSEELLQFVSDANPYMYVDRTAVDPAMQDDFDSSMARQNIGAEVDEQTAYYAVKNFLAEQNPQFVQLFEDISIGEWQKLCMIIAEEESIARTS